MATIEEQYKQYYEKNHPDDDTQYYATRRHRGAFSSDNPYYENLNLAKKKKDRSALYELATKWEAENAGYERELAERQKALDEQRAYDHPVQEIARQRMAGINPDIAGAGGAGGSGSGSGSMPMPTLDTPVQNTTPFSSPDADAQVAIGVLGAVTNVVGSFVNVGQAVLSGIEFAKTLPSRIKLLDSQAYVADKTKDDAVALVSEQLAGHRLSNRGQSLSNIGQSLNMLNTLSGFFTPESSDDDISNVLSSLGYDKDSIAPLTSSIRQYQSNPAFKKAYEQNKRDQKELAAWNATYTESVLQELTDFSLRFERVQNDFNIATQQLQQSVANFLNNQEHAETLAGAAMAGARLNLESTQFSRQQLRQDVEAFTHNLMLLKEEQQTLQSMRTKMLIGFLDDGKLTSAEEAVLDGLSIQITSLGSLGSQNLHNLYDVMQYASRAKYLSEINLNESGNVEIVTGMQKHTLFGSYTWPDLLSNQVGEDELVNMALGIADEAVESLPYAGAAYKAAKGVAPKKKGKK